MINNKSGPAFRQETRIVFRVLAGILAIFGLFVCLPLAVVEGLNGDTWSSWVFVICCVFAGIGMAEGARSGQWPFVWRGRQSND